MVWSWMAGVGLLKQMGQRLRIEHQTMRVMFCMYGSKAPYAKATLSKTNMEPEVTMISIADSSLTRSPIGFRLFHSFPQAIHAFRSV